MNRTSLAASCLLLSVCLQAACSDDGQAETSESDATTGDGDGDATASGDGDGDDPATQTDTDPTDTGDGDGDTGDGDGDTGDGDGDTGDGDGDAPPDKPQAPPCPYDEVANPSGVALELVASGMSQPVLALGHPTRPDELYIVERTGEISVQQIGGPTQAEPFLSLSVTTFVEYGLLGFDFHPYYPDDPRVYVNYSPSGESVTRVSEFSVDLDANVVIPESERVVLELHQPAPNHNGGMIAFGPDDYLYIGMGDGGGANDQFGTGLDPSVAHAKMLRIDVEPSGAADKDPLACQGCPSYGPFDYGIPDDNPFLGDPSVIPEAWALGMRNPWRFSFDPQDGDLYMGDVGQDAFEEIAVVEAGSDHGWSTMEGFSCFQNADCTEGTQAQDAGQVNPEGLSFPIHDYPHANDDCSVTGGDVYRSCEVPDWSGVYFFGDYCTGRVDALRWDGSSTTMLDPDGEVLETPVFSNVLGFGHNAWGDVFVCANDGSVYRIVPAN